MTTFPLILKELLGKKNFALKKELDGKPLVAPPWSHRLSYEHELRREAYKKCREQNIGYGGRRTATRNTLCYIGCSSSAWPIRHHQPRTSRLRAWCKKKSLLSSGALVPTGAGRPEVPEARGLSSFPADGRETRGSSSQDLNNSLFLVPLYQRRTPRNLGKVKGKSRGTKYMRRGFIGVCGTLQTQQIQRCGDAVRVHSGSATSLQHSTLRLSLSPLLVRASSVQWSTSPPSLSSSCRNFYVFLGTQMVVERRLDEPGAGKDWNI